MKFYQRESGTIVMVDENMKIYYLNSEGKWINDQTLLDMFTDDFDYVEISESEVKSLLGFN